MFLLRNAAKNIFRFKNRYILFGILYLILIFAASICVNVFIQMETITDNILREYAGVSKIELSFKDIYEERSRITKEEYLELKKIKHISDIRFLKYNFCTDYIIKENKFKLEVTAGETVVNAPIFVIGYNISLLHLVPEEFDLESGRMFKSDGECVISKNIFATDDASNVWNKTQLGDIITIKNDGGVHRQFTVVGIIKQNNEDEPKTNRRIIYTTLDSAEYFDAITPSYPSDYSITDLGIEEDVRIYPDDENFDKFVNNHSVSMGYEALVYLDTPETFLNLSSRLSKIEINNYNLTLTPFFKNFRPLVNLTNVLRQSSAGYSAITAFIIICVTIITTVILLSSRKYEIAVLRSVGMKKKPFDFILSHREFNLYP